MTGYYLVFQEDPVSNTFLFRNNSRRDGLVVLPEYRDLVCPKCQKLDEFAAIERGISKTVKIKAGRDIGRSVDAFYFFSKHGRAVLEQFDASAIEWYSLPGDADYFVGVARRRFPWWDRPGFRAGGKRCSHCNRYREIKMGSYIDSQTFQPFWPDDVIAAHLLLEGWGFVTPLFVVTEKLGEYLSNAGLTGFYLHPIAATFANKTHADGENR